MHVATPGAAPHLDQVCLAPRVEGEDLGPYEDEDLVEVDRVGLQQLQDVGEDADRQRQLHCPGTLVDKPAQEHQGLQAVLLAEQDLRGVGRKVGHAWTGCGH